MEEERTPQSVPEQVPEAIPTQIPQEEVQEETQKQAPQAEFQQIPQMESGQSPAPPKTKKKLLPIIAAIAAVCVVAILAVLFLPKMNSNSVLPEEINVYAKIDDDGTAFIPMFDGTAIQVKGDVQYCVMTADRKHIIALSDNGELYFTNPQQTDTHIVCDNCNKINTFRNDGFIYTDKDGNVYRMLFSEADPIKLGNDIAIATANDTISVLYALNDGNIFILKNTENEPIKVGYFPDSMRPEAIANDGHVAVWSLSNDSNEQSLVLWENDERFPLGNWDGKYNGGFVRFSDDQALCVVGTTYSNELWIKREGEDIVTAKMGANINESNIYTNVGTLSNAYAKDINCFYASSDADSGANVYRITMDGDREKILSKVSDYSVTGNSVVYLNGENVLYYSEFVKGVPDDEIKISADVQAFECTKNGKYVYFMKNCDDDVGSLYCYKLGEKEPVKVSSNVNFLEYFNLMYTVYSADGSSVLFYKDLESITHTYKSQGTLMYWHYGDDSAEKISSDVILLSAESGLQGAVKLDSFMYTKYTSVNKEDNIIANWMYYNGKESVKVASDIIID